MPHLHETDAQVLADDAAWFDWIDNVERLTGRDLANFNSAYIAHRSGQTASDYALEVVARAGEVAS